MLPAPSVFCALLTDSSPLPKDTCGPDLEYAPHFLDFMGSAQGKPEQQVGQTIIAAQDPDWRGVLKSGMTLCAETRDLRIAIVLTHAAIELYGLRGLADGLALILDWLTHHWETLHPVLEIDGEHDPLIRSNALAYLYAPHTCLKAIRKARLLSSRIGEISVSLAEDILDNRADSNAAAGTLEQLQRLIQDEREANHETFAALHEANKLQQAIATLWKDKLEAEYWPEFNDLQNLLERLSHLEQEQTDLASQEADTPKSAADTAPLSVSVGQGDTSSAHWPDAIDSRQQAFELLALTRQYFERHEPSHPAPLLISRIEKLKTLDFAQIIAELTPDGMAQLQQIAGQQASD